MFVILISQNLSANKTRWSNAGLEHGHRRRRWLNINPTLRCLLFWVTGRRVGTYIYLQSQEAVTIVFNSKQLLAFGFAGQYSCVSCLDGDGWTSLAGFARLVGSVQDLLAGLVHSLQHVSDLPAGSLISVPSSALLLDYANYLLVCEKRTQTVIGHILLCITFWYLVAFLNNILRCY